MKTIFTAICIAAISISAQAASVTMGASTGAGTITGLTGATTIVQTANKTTITGSNIQLGSGGSINVPGTLTIGTIPTGVSGGCGGGCITMSPTSPSQPTVGYEALQPTTFTSTLTIDASVKSYGLNTDSHVQTKRVVPELSKLDQLTPSAGVHAHPEFMNQTTVEDDEHLSLSQ